MSNKPIYSFEDFKNNFVNTLTLKNNYKDDDEHGIAGTIDFVDYQNGKYVIYDWKRSSKIIANGQPIKVNRFGKKAKFPITHHCCPVKVPDDYYKV